MNKNKNSIFHKILGSLKNISVLASNLIDRLLYSKRFLALVSLMITLLIFASVVFSEQTANQINQSTELTARVEVIGDLQEFEISDVPETVKVVVTGSSLDVRTIQNSNNYAAVLDISTLSEGNHRVKFERKGFADSLKVIFQPEEIAINISRKTSAVFQLTASYINQDRLEEQYILAEPSLEVNEVTINTSQEKLSQISEVRALIDVANRTETFNTVAKIVAYDQLGQAMDVEVDPQEVNVSVSVSSPNKQVNVLVTPVGQIPNNKAIDEIVIDYPSITLYGPNEVLDKISNINVNIDAALLKENETQLKYTLVRPEGVRSMDIETINLTIQLANRVSTEVEKSQVFFENNINNYDIVKTDGSELVVDVVLSGTQSRVDNVNPSLLRVSLDVSGLRVGTQVVNLSVTGPDPFVHYEVVDNQIEVEISEKGD